MEEGNNFYWLIFLRLLKQGRLKDLIYLKVNGFSIGEVGKDNKYTLEIFGEKQKHIGIELDAEDKHLGHDLVRVMLYRGKYVPFNERNEYGVKVLEYRSGDNYVKLATSYLGEVAWDYFKNYTKDDKGIQSIINLRDSVSSYYETIKFKDHKDYLKFVKEDYRVLEKELPTINKINRLRKEELETEVKRLQKTIKELEEDM